MQKGTRNRPRNENSAKFQRYEIASALAGEFIILLGVFGTLFIRLPNILLNIVHLGAFAFLFGMQLWVTFIAAFVMMKTLSKKDFGTGLSAVLSCYFNLEVILTSLVLCPYLIKHPYSDWTYDEKYQVSWLAVILLTTLASSLFWHQTCIQIMADREWEALQRAAHPLLWRDHPETPVPWYKKDYATCRSLANFVSIAGGVVHFLYLSEGVAGGRLSLACFCLLLGSQLWTTVPGGLAMIRSLSRHMFGEVQSVMFPIYFTLLTALSVILLYSYVTMHPYATWTGHDQLQVAALTSTLVTSLISLFYLTPLDMRIMREMYKVEKDEGCGHEVGMRLPAKLRSNTVHQKVHKRFMRAHAQASIVNLLGVVGSLIHLYHLASTM